MVEICTSGHRWDLSRGRCSVCDFHISEELLTESNIMITFHHDNGHGWLEVSEDQLADVGINPNDVSGYSYFRWNESNPPRVTLFLEEDSDGSKFDVAFRERYGYAPRYHDVHTDGESFIRSLERLDSARKRWELES